MSRCDDDCFCCYKSEARSTGGKAKGSQRRLRERVTMNVLFGYT